VPRRGAKIVLLDGDKKITHGRADANGEWVVIAQDPPLGAGQHELRVIQHVEGHAPVTSDQVVVTIVPDQKQSGPEKKTLVMIAPSSGAATLVQPPSASGVPKSGDLICRRWITTKAAMSRSRERPRPARRCRPTSMTRW
jgi:hypothetical protein